MRIAAIIWATVGVFSRSQTLSAASRCCVGDESDFANGHRVQEAGRAAARRQSASVRGTPRSARPVALP